MEKKLSVAVVVLTKDEQIHIERCISNAMRVSNEVYVVDSESTDNTCSLAEALGAEVVEHPWPGNQSEQFNWALDNLPLKSDWVLRLDADEYLTDELIKELYEKVPQLPADVSGVEFPRGYIFLGKEIRRGTGRINQLRLFRRGKGRCEQRLMDEHIELTDGKTEHFSGAFFDDNLNNLSWWGMPFARRWICSIWNMTSPGLPAAMRAAISRSRRRPNA